MVLLGLYCCWGCDSVGVGVGVLVVSENVREVGVGRVIGVIAAGV